MQKDIGVILRNKTEKIIVLLIGGDKSTQEEDIEKAKEICKKPKKQENEGLKV